MRHSFPSFDAIPTIAMSRNVTPSRRRLALRMVVGVMCLLGVLALAGCGVTVNVGGDSGGSQPGTTPGGGGIASVRPCTGAPVAPAKTPTIVLTVKDSYKTTQAHVGDVIEVQLDNKTHWSSPTHEANKVLSDLQPQGGMDDATQTCRWLYEAIAPGTASLAFTGSPLCESSAPCPAIARAEQFTIQVF